MMQWNVRIRDCLSELDLESFLRASDSMCSHIADLALHREAVEDPGQQIGSARPCGFGLFQGGAGLLQRTFLPRASWRHFP